MNYAIGLDIGGTKIAAGIVNSEGEILVKTKIPSLTETKETMYDQVVKAIDSVLEDFEGALAEIRGIGIGLPGKVDREQGIAVFQNNLPWKDFPLRERLKQTYPEFKSAIENDVGAAAYGEYFVNNITGDKVFTYVTLSTGVASSTIVDQRLLTGHGFSGELGLIPVKSGLENSKLIPLEKCTSGVAIEKYGRQHLGDPSLTTKDIFDLFYEGNEKSAMVIEQVAESLAYGFVSIISLLDPHEIIVGGSVAVHNPVLIELV
ncbi:MAG: ROK family protein, partial [Alkalibacterium sp.]